MPAHEKKTHFHAKRWSAPASGGPKTPPMFTTS